MRIHCNICAIVCSKTVPTFITSCSHIFCQPCLRTATKHTCPLCRARSAAIPLNKTMPKKVMLVFMDKPNTHLHETIKIRRFRMLQYRILRQLAARRMRKQRRMQQMDHKLKMVRAKVENMRSRIAKVREMRTEIRSKCSKLFHAMKNRTPLKIVQLLYESSKRTFARCEQLIAAANQKPA